jgi:hypothetical protein
VLAPHSDRFGLSEAQAVARARGGICVSSIAHNQQSRLEWRCSEGHRWTAKLVKVKRGNWCPQCAGKGPVTILHMRQIAAERGGKCLSKEYQNNHTPLQWRCGEGHEWWARPQDIRRTWCPYCARTVRLEIKDLRRIARSRGGKLLSTLYINGKTPLLWRCHDGHVWNAPASSVKPNGFHPGTWCPLCPRRMKGKPARLSIEEMQEIAKRRGGKCLSTKYVNANTALKWRCSEGHEWEAKPAYVKHGTWCPACSGRQKLTLEGLREEAIRRGGRLLSTEYVDAHSLLRWECSAGHQWEAAAAKIRYGTWCPYCARRASLSIETMRELAQSNGGECLSKRYLNLTTPLKWRCAQGHVWKATPGMVKPSGYQQRGTWCPECANAPRYGIGDMRELAASRGGTCLSSVYVNNDTPLEWSCAKGHRWHATPNSIRPYSQKTRGTWCPVCAVENRKLTIELMRAIAQERGGECLSKHYVNSRTPLEWRCAQGHTWRARPNHVKPYGPQKRGSWCPQCK